MLIQIRNRNLRQENNIKKPIAQGQWEYLNVGIFECLNA